MVSPAHTPIQRATVNEETAIQQSSQHRSRTGSCLPDGLETPLDDGVERLGPKFYYTQFRKLR